MDRAADIIPISSRSARRPPMLAAEPVRSTPEPSKRSWWPLLLVVPGLVLAVVAISRAELVKSVRNLPAADREALYHRTLTDVETTCTALEAHDGALRDHCLRQAEFPCLAIPGAGRPLPAPGRVGPPPRPPLVGYAAYGSANPRWTASARSILTSASLVTRPARPTIRRRS